VAPQAVELAALRVAEPVGEQTDARVAGVAEGGFRHLHGAFVVGIIRARK
jgi:hypothetical protein